MRAATVAVGTALAGGPPRRSQRAGLPHWALALGNLAAKRTSGNGCRVRVGGSHRVTMRFIRVQGSCDFWLLRCSA